MIDRPEPGTTFAVMTQTHPDLDPGLVLLVEVDEHGASAPTPAYLHLPETTDDDREDETQ